MHGKVSRVTHDGTSIFSGLPSPLHTTRYHSLVIDRSTIPDSLRITATSDDGEIMAIEHRTHPVTGVQFHPESALTEYGYAMLDTFLHGWHGHHDPRRAALPDRADGRRSAAGTGPASRSDDPGLDTVPPPVTIVR